MMRVIVDTNVAVVANGRAEHASADCVLTCTSRLTQIGQGQVLVIDDNWRVIREYMGQLRSSSQPGVGDAFLKWVLTNWRNAARCELVHLNEEVGEGNQEDEFEAFPKDEDLKKFDRSDRKFVALCLTHPEKPPILNAVDTDYWDHREALANHGVVIDSLCPDAMARQRHSRQ